MTREQYDLETWLLEQELETTRNMVNTLLNASTEANNHA